MMSKADFEQWMADLRSGYYAQGVGTMRGPYDEFCCLGVRADRIGPEDWKKGDWGYEWRGVKCSLPIDEAKQDGLDELASQEANIAADNSGRLDNWLCLFMSLNDRGLTFFEIADFAEKHFPREGFQP